MNGPLLAHKQFTGSNFLFCFVYIQNNDNVGNLNEPKNSILFMKNVRDGRWFICCLCVHITNDRIG